MPKDTDDARAPAWLEPDACVRSARPSSSASRASSPTATRSTSSRCCGRRWSRTFATRGRLAARRMAQLLRGDRSGRRPPRRLRSAWRAGRRRAAAFRPENHAYAAHRLPLYSHLRYLTVPRRGRADPAESLGVSLAKWWLGAAWTDGPAPTFDPGASARWWLPDHPSPGGGGRQTGEMGLGLLGRDRDRQPCPHGRRLDLATRLGDVGPGSPQLARVACLASRGLSRPNGGAQIRLCHHPGLRRRTARALVRLLVARR